ncbi:carboxyl-terminal processing protease [Chitinophaga skermanii]|uniref:Carboxyl-terminal processing protease n=1 Tax=Chitinophaga skermanii TaxID=331697 RepID=A0A327QE12_9BACT|nr:S41 family peptidase [Chitinophaga skermanii]RAJ02551.1 carboxyl-terminal processing protease [Chitinophaga skermanii]
MSNNRKLKVFLPFLFAVVLALGMFLGHKMPAARNSSSVVFLKPNNRNALQEVMGLLQYKYVDSLQMDDLQTDAIEALLGRLDPHSVYIAPTQLKGVNENLNGNFEGIGIEFSLFNDTVNVVNVITGGPSEKSGLQMGDKLIKVGDSTIAGVNISFDRIRKFLRGPRGSEIDVTFLRNNKLQTAKIQRGVIPIYSVDASYMINPEVGYIKINRFSEATVDEFMEAARTLTKAGMKKLIIDVRQNPGGILESAYRIADQLLEGSKVVVYTEGVHSAKKEYKTNQPGLFEKGALAILVDEQSASASEVLAGAIQDWDRGTIIGRRTFGKGLVQDQYDLSNGGALRLTIARYYLPTGRSIQKSYKDGRDVYAEDLANRIKDGELINKDSIHLADTVKYRTHKGRIVYGGGGIIPDVFTPVDTTHYSHIQLLLYNKNLYNEFCYEYYMAHKSAFEAYKDVKAFNQEFDITPQILQAFYTYVNKAGVNTALKTSRDDKDISLRLKSIFARQRWRLNGYYEVINQEDEMVQKALETIKAQAE